VASGKPANVVRSTNIEAYKKLQEILLEPNHPKSFKELGKRIGKPRTVVYRWIKNPEFLGIDTSDWFISGKKPTNLKQSDNYYKASEYARGKWDDAIREYTFALESGDKKAIDAAYEIKRSADISINGSAKEYNARLIREAKEAAGKVDLTKQRKKSAKGFNSYAKKLVTDGYKHWLYQNPNYRKPGQTIGKQAAEWWKYLPSDQKNLWFQEVFPVYDHNLNVWDEYTSKGKIAPSSALKELHHIQPIEFGGGHFAGQTVALDKPAHRSIHTPGYRNIYERFRGQSTLPIDVTNPMLVDERGRINQKNINYLDQSLKSIMNLKGGQRGFVNPRVAGALAIGSSAALGFMSLLSPGGREAAKAGIEKVKTVGESVLRNNPKIMETLGLLGVPQEKMFETIYNLQGQGEWKGDRRIDAGDIVQNAMGQDWMARNPNLYAGISTASDLILDPINAVGGGLLKAGVSGLRKLRNIWGN